MRNSLTNSYEFSIVAVMENEINVKSLRAKLQMTQAELGDAIGVDQSTVSLWEAGSKPRGPAKKLLLMLAKQGLNRGGKIVRSKQVPA